MVLLYQLENSMAQIFVVSKLNGFTILVSKLNGFEMQKKYIKAKYLTVIQLNLMYLT